MSTSSSEEGSGVAGHHTTSFGLESTGSILFSLPSDSSDIQTEITPPTSPTPSEGKMHTPRDILDASRRLGRISAKSALQGNSDMTSTNLSKQFHHWRASSQSIANDEAGYDADGDGDGDAGAGVGASAGPGTTATTRPVRRPTFLRIDTRQHRRVASMLAIRRPTSPSFSFGDTDSDVRRHRQRAGAKLPSISLLKPATTAGKNADKEKLESYELRLRRGAEPVGLGIGFPENHPLRSHRAFTMPVPTSASPISDLELEEEEQEQARRRSEWLPSSGLPNRCLKKKPTQAGVYAPSPVQLALRPTFLEVSPSPIEYLPARAGGGGRTFRCDDAHDRLEIERERYRARAREGTGRA